MPGGKNNAVLLAARDATARATVRSPAARANFDKKQRAVRGKHYQVDLATTTARRVEVGLDQGQALLRKAQ